MRGYTLVDDRVDVSHVLGQEIASIGICSDPLMTSEREQSSNRRWLFDILDYPLRRATGIEPHTFFSSIVATDRINRKEFFALSGITLDVMETQYRYDDSRISDASLDYLRRFIPPDMLLIGYELSEQTRRLLTRIGVTYVDIWLHPIRYIDDILFAFASNHPLIHQALQRFDLDEQHYYLYASRLKVQTYKGYARQKISVPPRSALFVGQMMNDKSVIENGRPKSLLDYRDRFANLARNSERVYYSRHPYLRTGDEQVLRFALSFPNVVLTEHPSYHYLTNLNIDRVMTISSSVGLEAKYFGKQVELLYRPIIALGSGAEDYASIFQDFVSPHFWAQCLAPLMQTDTALKPVAYLDRRDKLRDMLAFYWSYQHIDKLEALRQDFLSEKNPNLKRPLPTVAHQKTKAHLNLGALFKEFDAALKSASVVSFDLFDTLVTRHIAESSRVPELIDLEAIGHKLGVEIERTSFLEARAGARSKFIATCRGKAPQEALLIDRYRIVAEELGLPAHAAKLFEEAEEAADLSVLAPSELGKELLRRAQDAGVRVCITSDTFYREEMIRAVLSKGGIEGYDRLFLSSVVGLTKHSGDLFDHIAADLGCEPGEILHIGDNARSDGDNARARGLRSLVVSSIQEIAERSVYPAKLSFGDSIIDLVGRGHIRERLYQMPDAVNQTSMTAGDPHKLGYALFGPLVFGFAKWVLDRARERDVHRLLFLARDGQVVHRACEILAPLMPKAPRMEYVYASRRGTSVPLVRYERDVLQLLEANFSPVPLSDFLEARFGLPADQISAEALATAGITSSRQVVREEDRDKIQCVLRGLMPQLLAVAEEERRTYTKYLATKVACDERIAVVDIGHQGSLQRRLSELLAMPDLGGFYFATHNQIKDRLAPEQFYDSFLVHELPPNDIHEYNQFILNFEFLFLNSEGSFLRMTQRGEELIPIFRADGDFARREMAGRIHDGAVEFVRDFAATAGSRIANIKCQPRMLADALYHMFKNPTPVDAGLFEGMILENSYSGRSTQYIIAPPPEVPLAQRQPSLWTIGAKALQPSAPEPSPAKPLPTEPAAAEPAASKFDSVTLPRDLRTELRLAPSAARYGDNTIEIRAGESGHAVYGPYLRLGSGSYRVAFSLETETAKSFFARTSHIVIDIATDGGKSVLSELRLTTERIRNGGGHQELDFVLSGTDASKEVEVRVWTDGRQKLVLREATLSLIAPQGVG